MVIGKKEQGLYALAFVASLAIGVSAKGQVEKGQEADPTAEASFTLRSGERVDGRLLDFGQRAYRVRLCRRIICSKRRPSRPKATARCGSISSSGPPMATTSSRITSSAWLATL